MDYGDLKSYQGSRGFELKYYPLSLVLVTLWVVYIVGMFITLEFSVANGHGGIEFFNNYDWFPSVLLTVFAQGHTAVTAMHLARLGISALHDPAMAPRTWAELFWLSDRNWQGPVGFFATLWDRYTFHTKLSPTFILFSLTISLALPAPLFISRAYPPTTVHAETRSTALVLSPFNAQNGTSFIDLWSQIAIGGGAWTTNLTVQQMYGARSYIGLDGNATSDIFFSGDLQNATGYLPGIRLSGGCSVLQPDDALQRGARQYYGSDSDESGLQAFGDWCSGQGLLGDIRWSNLIANNGTVNSYTHWCSSFNMTGETDWMNTITDDGYTTTIVAWFNSTNEGSDRMTGFINCTSTFIHGFASLAPGKYFNNFERAGLTFGKLAGNASLTPVVGPFIPPLAAAFYDISNAFSTGGAPDDERSRAVARMLGYVSTFHDSSVHSVQPTLAQTAEALWRGATHMGAAIGVLSSEIKPVTVLDPRIISGRQRNQTWVFVSAGLLLAWLSAIVFMTARMFRRTFGSSLNSYSAARLLVDVPFLVEGHCAGELSENTNLRAGFLRVGDFTPDEVIGHVTSGGVGLLDSSRRYGAKISTRCRSRSIG